MREIEKNKPLVTVIMPAFNRENYISFAIESILNQDYLNFEFIIIDDCSTDATYNIIQEYAKRDQRIIVLRNKKNKGIVYSLNRCLERSRGKYIARMDDDDISLPERIEKQVNVMEKDISIVVAGTYFKPMDENLEFFGNWVNVCKHEMIKLKMMFECPICHPTVMIRASFLKENNLKYSYKYQYAEDYKLWSDIIQKGGKIINIPEVLLFYRISNSSISRNRLTSKLQKHNSEIIAYHYRQFILGSEIKSMFLLNHVTPLEFCKKQLIYKAVQEIQINNGQIDYDKVQQFVQYFCGSESNIHICFIYSSIQLQDLINGIFSILNNSTVFDHFYFYILHEGDFVNEKNILNLRKIKDFEFKSINIRKYENCFNFTTPYFKYLSILKHINIKKCILINSKIIARDSLNQMWNLDSKGRTIVAVAEQEMAKINFMNREFMLENCFENSVLVINLKHIFKNNILDKISFLEKTIFIDNNLVSKESVIMNIVFYGNWKNISSRYNTHSNLYLDKMSLYNVEPVLISCINSTIYDSKIFINYIQENYRDYIGKILEYNMDNDQYTSAIDIVKNSLSYKIGLRIIQSKTISKTFTLPFALIGIIYQDYIEKKIGSKLESMNVNFKTPNMEDCYDFIEGEKVKQHLAYQLGECFLKHPVMFVFYSLKIYIKWKKNGKR
ncbi:glycosyltransferase family 2 protein [Campylobacter coli]|uniref:glycosyltransferase family 2 protein n=1 Tax=Campylobacter TaxID=194 RepID=UPI00069B07B6|nr:MULTISPECIES: glycosyltransferase family 2 protein [Campylobacter]EAI7581735.1 glycosyltransferase [Campylobacter coli]EAJ6280817.1 glycosyltransferase [Campylobacter coli]EAK0506937.1 glycosyltransferase [Campylobacter coli]EAK7953351.1 glycosyltransferase family 2 protein [Campylobacter coli]ECK7887495.1 glycosyltransferase family 2 protein [Campylobacter coli]